MSPASLTEREKSIVDMHSLITRDLAASNELATHIARLRQDIAEGKPQPSEKADLLERSNKEMTKELVQRVESIESVPAGKLGVTDREMLQALSASLAICDMQAMRLAELRDLELTARKTKERAFLKAEVNKGFKAVGQEPEEELASGHASEYATDGLDGATKRIEHHVKGLYDGFESDDEYAASQHFEETVLDKSTWPLLYRIMSVNPDSMAADMQSLVNGAYKKLALEYSPRHFPNDPTAPALWEKITKAYNVLVDPDRRLFYNAHANVPAGLEDFDPKFLEQD